MKTVKLKIPVVVDAKGRWCACGWNPAASLEHQIATAREDLADAIGDHGLDPMPTTVFIVEATVEVPSEAKPKKVKGAARVDA